MGRPIGTWAKQQPSGTKSSDEHGQHSRGRRGAGAEYETKLPQPCHLVDQGGQPRREQQQSHARESNRARHYASLWHIGPRGCQIG